MGSTGVFKRRAVSPEQVVAAEAAAAGAPIVGDPRLQTAIGGLTPIYTLGNVYEVPLERIRSNPVNPRAVYTSQAVDEMAVSLQKQGQRVAATAFVDEENFVVLIEGETRLRGARAAGLTSLRVEIQQRPQNDLELYKQARAANVERRDQTPLDDALKWKELLERKVFSNQAALSRELDVPESTVSRTLALASMSQRIVFALADHSSLLNFQMLNAIREYSQAFGEEKTLDYIPMIEKNGWGYRRVMEDVANAKKEPVKRPRGTKETLEYAGGKGEIKVFENGRRVEVVLKGITDPEKATAFIEGLKALAR